VLLAAWTLSSLCSQMTTFGVSLWVLESTGKVALFAWVAVMGVLPGVLLTPLVGVIIDRYDRTAILLVSTIGPAVCTGIAWLLAVTGELQLWHATALAAATALFGIPVGPLLMASIPSLVEPRQLPRANAALSAGAGASAVLGPIAGAAVYGFGGLSPILALDALTFVVAAMAIGRVRLGSQAQAERGEKRGWWAEFLQGCTYLKRERGLLILTIFFAAIRFTGGIVTFLITPLVLAFSTASGAGAVSSAGSAGFLAGAVAMMIWGGPKKRLNGVFPVIGLQGVALMVIALRPSVWLAGVGFFATVFCSPIMGASMLSIWQTRVPEALRGRVFATREMIASSVRPLAIVVAGATIDDYFERWMAGDGALANTAGAVLGVGPGRGMALMIFGIGVLTLFGGLVGLSRHVRELESHASSE
jgi:MFS transporter, DHA3 family, macrolide efflux protein